MNKTVSVNISGFIFNIEEEAYITLKTYLDSIRKTFAGTEGCDEIMADIEARIAELFQEKTNERKQVVLPVDVADVISVMGEPELFREEEAAQEAPEANHQDKDRSERNTNRRLFRDPDDVVLGGVAAGVSHYVKIDPVYIRLAFALFGLLSFGTAAILYIILWAVVPKASSTAEKLKMRGQDVTLENIRQRINEEMSKVSTNVKNAAGKGNNLFRSFAEKAFSNMGNGLSGLGRILVKLIALYMLFLGIVIFIGVIVTFFAANAISTIATELSFNAIDEVFLQDRDLLPLAVSALLMIILPPVIGLIAGGLGLLLKRRQGLKGVGIFLLLICIAGVLLAFYIISTTAVAEFMQEHEKSSLVEIPSASDTLYFEVLPDLHFHNELRKDKLEFFDVFKLSESHLILGEPVNVYFRNAGNARPEIEILRRAKGPIQEEAIRNASEIEYTCEISDSLMRFAPYMLIPRANHYHGEAVDIIVRIPLGKKINFSKNSTRLLHEKSYAGRIMTMGPNGLYNSEGTE
jgi:phage shock protein PspC (stress-responsive transcriptional regulator)